ncbi:MAG: type II secretion system F family protein [Planctomycetota bacterium]|nr:type II secretion system F family protein [Planctomycetota bacterium]MDA1211097.1 type II secretion system F family protein [Planctomycetota bacterium]
MFIDFITVGAFLVFFLIVFLLGDAITGGRRVARNVAAGRLTNREDGEEKYTRLVFGPLTTALATIVPQSSGEVEAIERDLKRAGYYRHTALKEYMATRNALILMIIVTTLMLATLADPGSKIPEMVLFVGFITAMLGYALPRIVLHNQAERRVNRIQKGLPDALDIITMCITGGLPLTEALTRVSDEIRYSHRDVAVEFDIIRRQSEADTMAKALRQFAERIDSPEINSLSALVTQTQRMGTHVATAVCEYADSVRRAHRQRAEEQASKTSIKMLFPVVLCLAPPIYILLIGPPLIKMKNFIHEAHQPGGVLEPNVDGLQEAIDSGRRTGRLGRGG